MDPQESATWKAVKGSGLIQESTSYEPTEHQVKDSCEGMMHTWMSGLYMIQTYSDNLYPIYA